MHPLTSLADQLRQKIDEAPVDDTTREMRETLLEAVELHWRQAAHLEALVLLSMGYRPGISLHADMKGETHFNRPREMAAAQSSAPDARQAAQNPPEPPTGLAAEALKMGVLLNVCRDGPEKDGWRPPPAAKSP